MGHVEHRFLQLGLAAFHWSFRPPVYEDSILQRGAVLRGEHTPRKPCIGHCDALVRPQNLLPAGAALPCSQYVFEIAPDAPYFRAERLYPIEERNISRSAHHPPISAMADTGSAWIFGSGEKGESG